MNKLSKTIATIDKLPSAWRVSIRSFLLGKFIPFAGTASVRFEVLTKNECTVSIKNKKKVGNHIGTIHAAAMALAAETATGFVTGMNVPDSKILVIKTMELAYLKRTEGDLKATAKLSEEDIQRIHEDEKGDISVPVVLTDANNTESVTAKMVWAWVPKRKPA